jgi:uncharacterized protein YbjT (DUF2867 family)
MYDTVRSLVRRPTGQSHDALAESIVNFDDLEASRDIIKADDIYCAIGTTIRAAGSEDAFRRVDYDYAVNTAGIALSNGASRFFLVSSVGARSTSGVFYSRVKGEVEQTIGKMPYQSVSIFRPSFILGERKEKRPVADALAGVMKAGAFTMIGPFRKYRPIHADTIAKAMLKVASREIPGVRVYESNTIEDMSST